MRYISRFIPGDCWPFAVVIAALVTVVVVVVIVLISSNISCNMPNAKIIVGTNAYPSFNHRQVCVSECVHKRSHIYQ